MSGSNTTFDAGFYEDKGVGTSETRPCARAGAVAFKQGTYLYLFGGQYKDVNNGKI